MFARRRSAQLELAALSTAYCWTLRSEPLKLAGVFKFAKHTSQARLVGGFVPAVAALGQLQFLSQ
jgi:hypothetical protein